MVRADLEAAGIPYRDEAGRVFDFHALRHHFISKLAAAGVHPKVAQTLARHSTITLTMDRYAHLGLFDQTAALDKLPRLPASQSDSEARRATGTEGKHAGQHAGTTDTGCCGLTASDSGPVEEAPSQDDVRPDEMSASDNDCDPETPNEKEAPPGFEPGNGGFAIRCLTAWLRGHKRFDSKDL